MSVFCLSPKYQLSNCRHENVDVTLYLHPEGAMVPPQVLGDSQVGSIRLG
jgi:hypothetical protein